MGGRWVRQVGLQSVQMNRTGNQTERVGLEEGRSKQSSAGSIPASLGRTAVAASEMDLVTYLNVPKVFSFWTFCPSDF